MTPAGPATGRSDGLWPDCQYPPTVLVTQQVVIGTHSVDIDGELAQLDTDGYRPLRLPSRLHPTGPLPGQQYGPALG